MRRLLYIVLLVALSLPVFAKRDSHLQFRGIPITGSEKDMKDSLRSRDFHWGLSGTIVGYIGNVAGREMTITILTTPETNTVYALVAHGDRINNWDELKQEYVATKDLLKQKYGRPISHSERFHTIAIKKSKKRRAIRHGKCDYRASYNAGDGVVTVYIDSDNRVCIEFQDAIGGSINEKEILSEL